MGNWFNTEIAPQFSAEQGKDLSRYLRLKSSLHSDQTLTSRKNKKARLAFAEEHVVWTAENWFKEQFSDESKSFGFDGKQKTKCLASTWGD